MKAIQAPKNILLTSDWHAIQYTHLHQYHPNISQEYNKSLKAFGRGSHFVISGFILGVFSGVVNGKFTCIARLTPGILVHDWTIIDFVQPLKTFKRNIYIKIFDEDDEPRPKQVYKLGSRYYHGMYGDGIDAIPTYAILQCLRDTEDRTNFRTMYSFTLNDDYGKNGDIIDIPNIEVEDFRFPPNDTDPTDPIDPWKPDIPPFPDDPDPETEDPNEPDPNNPYYPYPYDPTLPTWPWNGEDVPNPFYNPEDPSNPDPWNPSKWPPSGGGEEGGGGDQPNDPNEPPIEQEDDYTTLVARSMGIFWALVVDGYK